MPPVKPLDDQNVLVPTSDFPSYAEFPFDEFNPVQSRIFEIYDQDCNVIIAAQTSAGKTVCAEMMMSHEVRKRGGKAMFLAPLKALAKEKIDDWTDPGHHFSNCKLSICTGDYRLTPARKKELENSDIILMTSEMLNSRCRNNKSEQNDWLKEIGTLVVDESHLLTVPGRGDHLEVGLMKLTKVAPNARIVFLSATMPNVDEIANWVSYQLTGRDTYLIESDFRPCPLGIHFETYFPARTYEATEEQKIDAAMNIIADYEDDKFLVFVHTKRTGHMMKKALEGAGYETEFHNADLEKSKRHMVEKKFREGGLQVIVATSTLAWGLNLPARRVIVLGVHRGLNEVDTYDIWQMVGRAGRPGYDPRGDAYILLPDNHEERHRSRLKEHQDIESRLLDHIGSGDEARYKTLAFHLVSEIHHGQIKTKDDVHKWYERSLAAFQANDLDDHIIDSTIDLLIKCRAIKEEDGNYKVTVIGMISSLFYYSPFDVADLRRNFKRLFDTGLEDNDLQVSMALANVENLRMGIVSKGEREDMAAFKSKVHRASGKWEYEDPEIKGGFAYFCLMNGLNAGNAVGASRTLQWDFPRLVQVLHALDQMNCKWGKKDWFNILNMRMTYGVKPHLIPLCTIPDIGKVRAERLWNAGVRSIGDVARNQSKVQSVLNMKKDSIDKICNAAKEKLVVESLISS